MLAMGQLEYGLGYLNDKLTHMLLYNSKVLIQNHVVWSYVIKMNIFECVKTLWKYQKEFKISVPEVFVRIENADVKNHW